MSTQWRFEASTKTIRTVPGNHWVCTMDSWDGALNHEANAKLITAAPVLLAALQRMTKAMDDYDGNIPADIDSPYHQAIAAINAAMVDA